MEPDHSSSDAQRCACIYPDIQIVGNAKTLQMLAGILRHRHAGTLEVKEGDTHIALGGKTLSFHMSADGALARDDGHVVRRATGTLFSGDAFGTFGAHRRRHHRLAGRDPTRYWDEMRRYYACIVGKYGGPVQKALAEGPRA